MAYCPNIPTIPPSSSTAPFPLSGRGYDGERGGGPYDILRYLTVLVPQHHHHLIYCSSSLFLRRATYDIS
eukprot:4653087-Pyramimonas_sp.AAC.1